jgi:hypothetical protein
MLVHWLNRRTLEQLMSLASVGAVFAAMSCAPPNFVLRAMTRHLALALRLSVWLVLVSGSLILLWRTIQALKRGVNENRWGKSRLEFWRHYFRLTDWPVFFAFLAIWVLWPHSNVFFPTFALMRTHTLIMNAFKEPAAVYDGIWGRWESTKPVVSNHWGKHTSNV